jgi:hypothetical protein
MRNTGRFRFLRAAGAVLAATACGAADEVAGAARAWELRAAASAGLGGGDVTYAIGRTFTAYGETERIPFPISELEWPTDVAWGGFALSAGSAGGWEVHVAYSASLGGDAGTMKDSDWDYD